MIAVSTQVEDGDSAVGVPTRALRRPHRALVPLLARDYVGFADSRPAFGHWLMPPTGTATIILNLGEPFGDLPDAFVAGLDDRVTMLARSSGMRCFDLKLTPLGAYRLFGTPMHELTNRAVDAEAVLGSAVRGLMEALRDMPSWGAGFDRVESLLLNRLDRGPRPAELVEWMLRRIQESGGQVAIGALATETRWSRRHLVSMFKHQVGVAPKTMARIVRLNGVLRSLDAAGDPAWAALAVDHGYYDQSHLHRDFREFTGTTPSDYVNRHLEAGHMVGDGVTSVQDAATTSA